MALTPAEKQRAYRQRLKDRQNASSELFRANISDQGFSAFMAKRDTNWEGESGPLLDSVGASVPGWDNGDFSAAQRADYEAILDEPYPGSLGRAERTVEHLVAVARLLAQHINRFKLQRIDEAMAELEAASPTGSIAIKRALTEAAELERMKARLSREVRFSMPAFTVKGE